MRERIYALDMIETVLYHLQDAIRGKPYYDVRQFTPYLLSRIEDFWLPLNRDYKPLGIGNKGFVKYEDYKFLSIPDHIINKNSKHFVLDGPSSNYMYFFTDRGTPVLKKERDEYIERVKDILFINYTL